MTRECRYTMWEWLFSSPLTDREMTTLTLWQQRKKSRQFPVTLGFNLLMLLLCVSQCLMVSLEYTNYNRGNENGFRNVFHPEELRDGLFSIQEVMEVLEDMVEKYYTFPETAVSPYSHVKLKGSESDEPLSPVLTVYRYRSLDGRFWLHPIAATIPGLDDDNNAAGESPRRRQQQQQHRRAFNANRPRNVEMATEHSLNWIDDEDLAGDFGLEATVYDLPREQPLKEVFGYTGPESLEGSMLVHNEFYHVSKMTLDFSFRGADIGVLGIVPFYWDLELEFKVYGAQVTFGIDVDLRIRNTTGISKNDVFEVMNVIILLFATISFLASLRGLILNTLAYSRTRRAYLSLAPKSSEIDSATVVFPTWHSIPFGVKVHFWSFWYTLDALSCFVFITAAILGLLREEGLRISSMYSVIFGFGTMLAFLNMLRYLECHPRLYLHISTLRGAFVSVAAFCLSVSPIFLGYTFFGLLNFGPYAEKFMNLDETATTLFCLIAGDDIHDTFEKIADGGYPVPFVGRCFIYTFVIIFLTSVLNVFIFLIEDAYDSAKQTLRGVNGQPIRRRQSIVQLSAIFDNIDRWRAELGTELAVEEPANEEASIVQQEGVDIELAQFSSGISSDAHAASILNAKSAKPEEPTAAPAPREVTATPTRSALRIDELQRQLEMMAELLEGTQKQLANLQDQLALISQSNR